MGIVVAITPLWAELATWKAPAHEVIARPEYWAIRGASRMGKALTATDRVAKDELEPSTLRAATKTATELCRVLGRTEPGALQFGEPAPAPAASNAEARAVLEQATRVVAEVPIDGVELLVSIAHALQAGLVVSRDAAAEVIVALAAEPPKAAQRSQGPMSSLLALGAGTLFMPAALKHAWDGPFGTLASSAQLRADLDALPARLSSDVPGTVDALGAARQVVIELSRALEGAQGLCVRMSAGAE